MVGQVGSDPGADFMRSALSEAGVLIDGTVLDKVDTATGTAVVMVDPEGENSIVIVGGANTASWSCEGQQRAAVEQASMVLMQRELDDSVNERYAEVAHQANVPVMLDAGGAEGTLSEKLLHCLTYLSPNETELGRLTGMPTGSREETMEAAQMLQRKHGCQVLVKLGAKGSMLCSGVGRTALHISAT